MREQLTSVHKYDSGIAEYVDTNDAYDETSGDVEAPTGWFGQAGRRIIMHDSVGFVTTYHYPSVEAAEFAFDGLNNEYATWHDEGLEGGE